MEQKSGEADTFSSCSNRSTGHENYSVAGMDSVVATVSGYHGSERFKLIKLINQSGASYLGNMTKATTHLVCWQFQGRKYSMAKSFGTEVVNHRWFEDCVKAGKRLPEHLYTMQSGQELGPILWEAPAATNKCDKRCLLTEKEVLTDRSNTLNTDKLRETGTRCLNSELLAWSDSFLVRKNSFPIAQRNGNKSGKIVKPVLEKTSKDCRLSDENWPLEPHKSCPSMSLERHKRSVGDVSRRNVEASAICKGRRVVKKKAVNTIFNYIVLDHKQEDCQPESSNRVNNNSYVLSDNSDNWSDNALAAQETNSQNISCDEGDKRNEGAPEEVDASIEVSCAICWTEFSSTRGILSCGHRFCYSCIQGWVDQMTRQRKDSTCPLCKVCFFSITKMEDATLPDQKVYSQTIPVASSNADIVTLLDRAARNFDDTALAFICFECRSGDTEDCLLRCRLCRNRWVHSFCLDPPLVGSVPWTCNRCNIRRRPSYDFV